MLHVTEAQVKRLLTFSKAIELVREAYVMLDRGEAINPPRSWLAVPRGAWMFFMPAHVHGHRSVAVKAARVNPANHRISLPTVLLTIYAYDAVTGVQLAEVEADWLTAVRTAASTAVATDALASCFQTRNDWAYVRYVEQVEIADRTGVNASSSVNIGVNPETLFGLPVSEAIR